MGWRERDYARFTDAEREAFYGSRTFSGYAPPAQRRSLLAPGAGLAIAVSAAFLFFGRGFLASPLQTHHTFPLNLPATETYRSTLTLNGSDPQSAAGDVVATGQWNGGTWTPIATTALASDHTWSLGIPLDEQGTLSLRIALPSGDVLAGSLTVQP